MTHQVVIWLGLLAILFTMIIGYAMVSRVLSGGLFTEIQSIEGVQSSPDAVRIISQIESTWKYFMLVLVLGLIFWAISYSSRESKKRGGY